MHRFLQQTLLRENRGTPLYGDGGIQMGDNRFIVTTIANCKTASIRRVPWITIFDHDIVGEKTVGETIEINPNSICYDRTDRKFYRTRNPKGWIHDGVIAYGGGE